MDQIGADGALHLHREPAQKLIGQDRPAVGVKIVRQPRDEKIPAVAQAKILAPQQPHARARHELAPRHIAVALNIVLVLLQQFELGGIDPFVVARIVAKPAPKDDGPNHAEHRKNLERHPPAHERHHGHNQQRRERPAPARAHPHERLRPGALVFRQPRAERFGQVGETTRFARSEEKTHDPHGGVTPRPAGRGGEKRPPEHHAHEHLARTDLVAQPAGGDFKQRVRQAERGEDRAHLRIRETHVPRDVALGLRNCDAMRLEFWLRQLLRS